MSYHGPSKITWDAWRDAYARMEQAKLMVEGCRTPHREGDDEVSREQLKEFKLASQAMIGACDMLKAATAQLTTYVGFQTSRSGPP